MNWTRPLALTLSAIPVAGTLLSLVRRPHWIFRMWDFPRLQLAVLAAAGATSQLTRRNASVAERTTGVLNAAVVAWQAYRIHTYTPLSTPTVKQATKRDDANRIVLMMTNVLMENEQHARLLEVVREADPDVVLAVEVNERWDRALEELHGDYPYTVRRPQENYYGMLLLSRLELVDTRVDYLVQEDIPSLHTRVRLRSGTEVTLHGLHPRPPEPLRDQPSSPRDAELVIVGRSIGDGENEPTIVAGDLNDVAWSETSELFVRLSGLLDPRVGRGFYNSYNANNPLFRYPLDHVFHSTHFKLVRIERLPPVGSDHFPILIELQYEESADEEQEESQEKEGDRELADEMLEQEAQDAATGADRPNE